MSGSDKDPGDVLKARHEAAIAAREARAKAREAAELEAEVLKLETLERLETTHGALGQQINVIDCTAIGEGIVVVKLGEETLLKRFADSKCSDTDAHLFVSSCLVHPSVVEFSALTARRPAVLVRAVEALKELYGVRMRGQVGEF